MTRKTIWNEYYTFSVKYNFENGGFMLSPDLIIILCSHLWKVLCSQSVLISEEVK